jgi:elongation factor P
MLQYNEIREKKIIIYNDEPYEVVESRVARKQQMKPQNQVKLRSLIAGKTIAATFHVSESAKEAEVEKKEIKFIYHNRGEYWFSQIDNPKNRFKLNSSFIGDIGKFLKENENVTALIWEDTKKYSTDKGVGKIIKIILPIKIEYKVKEAPPAVKGNTTQGASKIITLENNTTITAPMFINKGDTVVVNTEKGEYVERV